LQAASFIAGGRTVAFPTETVYGLGANAFFPQAVEAVFEAKGRPGDNPLIIHIAYLWQASQLAIEVPEKAKSLARIFWPGPLTLVLKKVPGIPYEVTGGLDTVGIRMPDHPVARELIRLSQCPIAAPSANLSGKPSPTTARHVLRDLYGRIDGVLDGGSTQVGLESTVLDVTSKTPVLLRPGGITREQIEKVIGPILLDPNLQHLEGDEPPRSPGLKYAHYAPEGKVYLVDGGPGKAAEWISRSCAEMQEKGLKTAILCSKETAWLYSDCENHMGFVEILGSKGDLGSVARHLYAALRRCDQEGIEVIYLEAYSGEGLGMAVMNRMYKASGSNVIKV
jgi:L-threonylcarbamoyladenylate synthase